MEEAPGNGKESSHSVHANGMNECGTKPDTNNDMCKWCCCLYL